MTKLTPLQKVKQKHGSKQQLVDKLADRLERFDDEDAGEFKERLLKVSNKKLLRLNESYDRLENEFGDKAKLVSAIIALRTPKQANDADYAARLLRHRVTRLLDMHDSAAKAARA